MATKALGKEEKMRSLLNFLRQGKGFANGAAEDHNPMARKKGSPSLPQRGYGIFREFLGPRRSMLSQGNPFPKEKLSLVVEHGNGKFPTGQSCGARGMGMDYDARVRPGPVDRKMQPPLRGRMAKTPYSSIEVEGHHLAGPEAVPRNPCGRDKDRPSQTKREVAGATYDEAELPKSAIGPSYLSPKGPQGSCAHKEAGSPLFP